MKKILYLWDRLDSLGGVEIVIYNLSKKLMTRGFKIYLGVFKDGFVRQMFEEIGVEVVVFERNAKFDLSPFKNLYSFIKHENIDIIHTHGHFPGIIGRLVGKILRRKVLSTYHLALNEDGHPLITKLLTKITLPLADFTTFVSQKVESSFFGNSMVFDEKLINKRKHFTIYNGIDLEEINRIVEKADKNLVRKQYGIDKDDIFLLNVGRLTEQKGQKYLVEAMRVVVEKYQNVKLIIIGEGELKEWLNNLINQYNLQGHIKIFPYTREILKVMASSDIFILPSLWEGFGIVLIESMAVGTPIIATDVTGINEVIINGYNGILVNSRDSESLANTIIKLIEDKKKIEYLISNAKYTVGEKFSLDRMTYAYELLYRKNV